MKTRHIYSADEVGESVELYAYMQENGIEDIYDLFPSDPDILRIDGNEVYFTEVEADEHTAFVIYADMEYRTPENEIKTILERFFADTFRDCFERMQSSWAVFRSLAKGIAYRNGQGYHYAIWSYTGTGGDLPPASFP